MIAYCFGLKFKQKNGYPKKCTQSREVTKAYLLLEFVIIGNTCVTS